MKYSATTIGLDIAKHSFRNGPQKLDSALSEIFVGFQAANLRFT